MSKKSAQATLYPRFRMTPKSKDLPASQGMLYLVRSELKADIKETRSDLKADISEFKSTVEARFSNLETRFSTLETKFSNLETRFSTLETKFSSLETRFSSLETRFLGFESKLETIESRFESRFERVMQAVHHVASEVARIGVLVEEQNSKNNLVLEGHTGLAQRQDRVEMRLDDVERTIRLIGRTSL